MEKAEVVQYHYELKGQELMLDPYFSVTPSDKWAFQRVSITVRVPKGKFLHLDPSLQLYYGHFWGRYWEHKDRGTKGLILSTNEEGELFNSVDDPQKHKVYDVPVNDGNPKVKWMVSM